MCKIAIDARISNVSVFREDNVYASTVGKGGIVHGPLHYETIEVTFDIGDDGNGTLRAMRHRLVGRVISYLNSNGYSEAIRRNDVPYVGPANMCYIMSSPDVDVPNDNGEAIAVSHSGTFIPNLKFRFRVPEKPGVLARPFRKPHKESAFYSGVKSFLLSIAAESVRKEKKPLEVCVA